MTRLNQQTLLLNASFEPLHVVSLRHAICLMCLEKVDVIETNGLLVRSPSVEIEAPSVVRLRDYVRLRKRGVKFNRRNILRRDNHTCQYCGRDDLPRAELTVDHILPLSRHGKHIWENVVTSCIECNSNKSDRTPAEAGMALITRPKEPSRLTFIQNAYIASSKGKPEWKKYLFIE